MKNINIILGKKLNYAPKYYSYITMKLGYWKRRNSVWEGLITFKISLNFNVQN